MTEFVLENISKLLTDNDMVQRTKTELIETLENREGLIQSLESRLNRSEGIIKDLERGIEFSE